MELNAQLFSSPVTPTEEEEAHTNPISVSLSPDDSPPHPSTAPRPESLPHLEFEAPAISNKETPNQAMHESEVMYQEEQSAVNNTFELKRDLAELSFDG